MKTVRSILLCVLAALPAVAKDCSDCFIPGETIEYKVSWMGIPIAWSRTTTESLKENGRDLVKLRIVSQTYSFFDHIFKVDDATEVVIDPRTGLPLRVDFVLNEGSIHKSHLTTIDHEKKVAVFQDRISKDIKEIPIASDTRDLYSFIYSARYDDLADLAKRKLRVLVEGKMYDLGLKILSDETVKLPLYGKVPCTEVEPEAQFDGIFLRQGKIFFWISKQERRMVTAIQAKVAVGNITVKLQEVSGPGDDFWIKNKEQ